MLANNSHIRSDLLDARCCHRDAWVQQTCAFQYCKQSDRACPRRRRGRRGGGCRRGRRQSSREVDRQSCRRRWIGSEADRWDWPMGWWWSLARRMVAWKDQWHEGDGPMRASQRHRLSCHHPVRLVQVLSSDKVTCDFGELTTCHTRRKRLRKKNKSFQNRPWNGYLLSPAVTGLDCQGPHAHLRYNNGSFFGPYSDSRRPNSIGSKTVGGCRH